VLERVYKAMEGEREPVSGEVCFLDSTTVKTRSDTHGAENKDGRGDRKEPGRMEYEDTRGNGGG
jgi:hypothetical protein